MSYKQKAIEVDGLTFIKIQKGWMVNNQIFSENEDVTVSFFSTLPPKIERLNEGYQKVYINIANPTLVIPEVQYKELLDKASDGTLSTLDKANISKVKRQWRMDFSSYKSYEEIEIEIETVSPPEFCSFVLSTTFLDEYKDNKENDLYVTFHKRKYLTSLLKQIIKDRNMDIDTVLIKPDEDIALETEFGSGGYQSRLSYYNATLKDADISDCIVKIKDLENTIEKTNVKFKEIFSKHLDRIFPRPIKEVFDINYLSDKIDSILTLMRDIKPRTSDISKHRVVLKSLIDIKDKIIS